MSLRRQYVFASRIYYLILWFLSSSASSSWSWTSSSFVVVVVAAECRHSTHDTRDTANSRSRWKLIRSQSTMYAELCASTSSSLSRFIYFDLFFGSDDILRGRAITDCIIRSLGLVHAALSLFIDFVGRWLSHSAAKKVNCARPSHWISIYMHESAVNCFAFMGDFRNY